MPRKKMSQKIKRRKMVSRESSLSVLSICGDVTIKAAREQVSADFIECKRGSLAAGEFKREAVRERAP
jgi:hypothetical protein